ncbi:MAG: DUF4920 domain-containing protein [Deltaproteobacteria bacterium]|nr:DUF4920 domain-containing protein [Deltaproteobacteria bacterium]
MSKQLSSLSFLRFQWPLLLPAAALLLWAGLATAESEKRDSFGEELVLTEATSLEEILADPESFHGKRVRVEGAVQDVCPLKGCWMDLAPTVSADGSKAGGGSMNSDVAPTAKNQSILRVKVDDGVIVFPKDAAGSSAIAEGTVELIDMNRDQYIRWMAHEAEEKGETFDASTVGEGPFQRIQIRGVGAVIEKG